MRSRILLTSAFVVAILLVAAGGASAQIDIIEEKVVFEMDPSNTCGIAAIEGGDSLLKCPEFEPCDMLHQIWPPEFKCLQWHITDVNPDTGVICIALDGFPDIMIYIKRSDIVRTVLLQSGRSYQVEGRDAFWNPVGKAFALRGDDKAIPRVLVEWGDRDGDGQLGPRDTMLFADGSSETVERTFLRLEGTQVEPSEFRSSQ